MFSWFRLGCEWVLDKYCASHAVECGALNQKLNFAFCKKYYWNLTEKQFKTQPVPDIFSKFELPTRGRQVEAE